jgi:hypothetical protein
MTYCTLPIPWAIAWRFTGAPEAANDARFEGDSTGAVVTVPSDRP